MDETREAKALENCKKGNIKEFGVLYDAYVDRIYSFIYYKTFHKETAEDLTSTTFMKALEHIARFNEGSLSSWLYRIARNTVIDHYRTSKKVLPLDESESLTSSEDPVYDLEVKQQVASIRESLKILKPEHREIVLMRLWDELTYEEIASVTHKSAGNCKVIFSRSLSALKEFHGKNLLLTLLLLLTFPLYE